jgi:hypothetical protein
VRLAVAFAYHLGKLLRYTQSDAISPSRIIAITILVTCIECPLVDMFDNWDHAVQTGNETEYAWVALALCVGVAYSFARAYNFDLEAH